MPLNEASTRTSRGPGGRRVSRRNAPRPGAVIQNAVASGIEAALDQNVVAEHDTAGWRPQPGTQPRDLGQGDAWPPRADDQRCDRDLQPVQAAGGEEVGDRD